MIRRLWVALLWLAVVALLTVGSVMFALAVKVGAAVGAHVLLPTWLCLVIGFLTVVGGTWLIRDEMRRVDEEARR